MRAVVLAAVVLGLAACAFGEEDGGCRDDGECPDGYVCRAGGCFRFTTEVTPADAGDAPYDAGDAGDADAADAAD